MEIKINRETKIYYELQLIRQRV